MLFIPPGPPSKTALKIIIGVCILGPGLLFGWVFWTLDHFVGTCIMLGAFVLYKILAYLACK